MKTLQARWKLQVESWRMLRFVFVFFLFFFDFLLSVFALSRRELFTTYSARVRRFGGPGVLLFSNK